MDCEKLKLGDICFDQDGSEWEYIGIHNNPVYGYKYMFSGNNNMNASLVIVVNGSCSVLHGKMRILKIKPKLGIISGFINVYDYGVGQTLYPTRKLADHGAGIAVRTACKEIYIKYENGDGL